MTIQCFILLFIENIDIFITGDKDFLDVEIEMPEIMMPGEFLEKVIKNQC